MKVLVPLDFHLSMCGKVVGGIHDDVMLCCEVLPKNEE
jgi:hypothetical protein